MDFLAQMNIYTYFCHINCIFIHKGWKNHLFYANHKQEKTHDKRRTLSISEQGG